MLSGEKVSPAGSMTTGSQVGHRDYPTPRMGATGMTEVLGHRRNSQASETVGLHPVSSDTFLCEPAQKDNKYYLYTVVNLHCHIFLSTFGASGWNRYSRISDLARPGTAENEVISDGIHEVQASFHWNFRCRSSLMKSVAGRIFLSHRQTTSALVSWYSRLLNQNDWVVACSESRVRSSSSGCIQPNTVWNSTTS